MTIQQKLRLIFNNKELKTIIEFNVSEIKGLSDQNIEHANLSMVQDVMESIEPLDERDKKSGVLGKILAVDDNKNNTNLLKKRLEKQGHTVITANDGREALLHLQTQKNDVFDFLAKIEK